MSKKKMKAVVWREDDWFIAKAFGLEVVSQGKTKKEAIINLREAVDLYLEDEGVNVSDVVMPEYPEITSLYA